MELLSDNKPEGHEEDKSLEAGAILVEITVRLVWLGINFLGQVVGQMSCSRGAHKVIVADKIKIVSRRRGRKRRWINRTRSKVEVA